MKKVLRKLARGKKRRAIKCMTSLLFISHTSELSEVDKLAIDKSVFENRFAVRKFLKKVRVKGKVIVISTALGIMIFFSEVENVDAIGLTPMPQAPIMRLDNQIVSTKFVPSNVRLNIQKQDKITFIRSRELPVCIYMMDKRFLNTPEVSELIKQVRGGNLTEVAAVAVVIIILIWQIIGIEGFQLPQPPIVHPNGAVVRPANGGIQGHLHHPKAAGKFTLRMAQSNQCPAHQTQISGFVKNGKVDLRECYDEVMRRSESLHCENWRCDFERFKSLATENGRVDDNSAREAITVLNGEMLGLYSNAERVDYGKGVYGPDFKVIGQGEYSHVTHVEVKNPVGSDIEKASRNGYSDIVKQGNKIGDKISKQQSKWSNATFRATLSNLDPNTAFPQSPANTLGLVDEFDVPISEKMIVQNAVENNCTNTSNVIFINNETNI